MYTDSTCTLQTVTGTKNAIGHTTDVLTDFATVNCYLAEEAGTRNTNGNEAVTYTHLLYIPYTENVNASMVVLHNGGLYDITGVWPAARNHHLELGLTRRSV